MKGLKYYIKKHDKLYIIARCIKSLNDPNFIKLIRGYYDGLRGYTPIFIEHRGEKYPDKIAYVIRFGEPADKKHPVRDTGGFCSKLRQTLLNIDFADHLGMVPVVEWQNCLAYYDPGMDSVTTNVFQYYFNSVSVIDCKEINDCRNIIIGRQQDSFVFLQRASDMGTSYSVEEDEIKRLGYLYKKYIHLNQATQKFMDKNLTEILKSKKILGVHIRGTDFNLGLEKHPIAITAQEYLIKAKEVYGRGGYEKVFLATDDANALALFQKEFKEDLLYYKDVFRNTNHMGVQNTPSERPLHYYNLGLEILRDVYTLASCDSLICGLSNVSFVVRSINLALDRRYTETVIMEQGVHAVDEPEAKAYISYIRERKKKKKLMGG